MGLAVAGPVLASLGSPVAGFVAAAGGYTAGALLAKCHLACGRRDEARTALDEVVVYRSAVRDPQALAELEDAHRELSEADATVSQ